VLEEEATMDGLDKGFWLKLVGGVLLLGLGIFVVFLLLDLLVWGFGFLGGLIVASAILLFIAWRYDKRQQTSHRAE
jgi:hypothetical protein